MKEKIYALEFQFEDDAPFIFEFYLIPGKLNDPKLHIYKKLNSYFIDNIHGKEKITLIKKSIKKYSKEAKIIIHPGPFRSNGFLEFIK
jgi:hypothetical protein